MIRTTFAAPTRGMTPASVRWRSSAADPVAPVPLVLARAGRTEAQVRRVMEVPDKLEMEVPDRPATPGRVRQARAEAAPGAGTQAPARLVGRGRPEALVRPATRGRGRQGMEIPDSLATRDLRGPEGAWGWGAPGLVENPEGFLAAEERAGARGTRPAAALPRTPAAAGAARPARRPRPPGRLCLRSGFWAWRSAAAARVASRGRYSTNGPLSVSPR